MKYSENSTITDYVGDDDNNRLQRASPGFLEFNKVTPTVVLGRSF